MLVAFAFIMNVKIEKVDFLLFLFFVAFLFFSYVFFVASTVTFFGRVRAPNPPMRGNLEGTQSID